MKRKVMVITDCPDKSGSVLMGSTGVTWTKLLNEVGLDRLTDVELRAVAPTNVDIAPMIGMGKKDPNAKAINGHMIHKQLIAWIARFLKTLEPDTDRLIIGLGPLPLLMLAGEVSIKNYRGSMLQTKYGKFIPTYHPSTFRAMWEWRYVSRLDYLRALRYRDDPFPKPNYDFQLGGSYSEIMVWLTDLQQSLDELEGTGRRKHISCDIETFRRTQISVCGIGVSASRAIAIPFLDFQSRDYSAWSIEQEYVIIRSLESILTHRNAEVSGQNYHYDQQYFGRYWGFKSRHDLDAMHMMHSYLPGEMEKSLAFLSSIFCEYHVYWKDQGKAIHDAVKTPKDMYNYLEYNAKDCCTTWESCEALRSLLDIEGLNPVYDFQQEMFDPLLKTMLRGTRYNVEQQRDWFFQLSELRSHYEAMFERVVPSSVYFPSAKKGSSPWYNSPTKMKTFLYDILCVEKVFDVKTKRPTTNEAALKSIGSKEPVLAPLLNKIIEYRSIGVFASNFLSAAVDDDARMRTFYNISGTETFRLSSRQDVWGRGANLQNIPKGGEK